MKSNVFENVNHCTSFTTDDLRRTITEMSIEQLLFAIQMCDRGSVSWTKKFLGGMMLSVVTDPKARPFPTAKSFDFSVDHALQIYEFPQEAHELLIEVLIEECCK